MIRVPEEWELAAVSELVPLLRHVGFLVRYLGRQRQA
jgi:hypothetical protein